MAGAPARQQARLRRAALMGPRAQRAARPRPPLALDAQESQVLLDTLNSERFADTAPAAVHATLLDEGRYLASVRTMCPRGPPGVDRRRPERWWFDRQ